MAIDDEQKIRMSAMWDTLKRYDGYISTVNFRCGLITSFSAAIFGGVLLKADELIKIGGGLDYFLVVLLCGLVFFSLLSIYWVVRTIWPDLSTNKSGVNKPSLFFFHSVASKFDSKSYADTVHSISIDDLERDLAIQVHEVAEVTTKKFKVVSKAAWAVKWSLLLMALIFVVVLKNSMGIELCLP